VQHRRPDAPICLTSALAHHGLTDAIPAALDVAIPRGSRTPASTGAIAWRQFDRATFEIGRETLTIPGSDQTIGIYSPEQSIADRSALRRDWIRTGMRRAAGVATLGRQTGPADRLRLPPTAGEVLGRRALEMLG
jgi:hypothetical protein